MTTDGSIGICKSPTEFATCSSLGVTVDADSYICKIAESLRGLLLSIRGKDALSKVSRADATTTYDHTILCGPPDAVPAFSSQR